MERHQSSLVEAALLRGLYERLPIVLGINGVVSLGTALVFAPLVGAARAWWWWAGMLLVLLLRLGDWAWHRRASGGGGGGGAAAHWRWRFTLGAGATGVVWGSCGFLFYDPALPESLIFLPFVLAGMIGGALTVLSGCMTAYVAFLFCTLAPYTVRLALTGDVTSLIMAALLLFYMFSLPLLARRLNTTLMASVALGLENERLIGELRAKQGQLEATFEHINQGVAVFGSDGRLLTWNPRHAELHGYPRELYSHGAHLEEFLAHDQAAAAQEDRSALPEPVAAPLAPARFEQRGAAERILAVERSPMPDGGFVTTSTDITEHKQAEAKMRHLAQHDALTDLPNRLLFQDRLDQAIARARRSGQLLAVVLIDLDRFKAINDEYGHGIGDQVLRVAGSRLVRTLRATDTVARIGGDEFALILTDLASPSDALAIAHKVCTRLASPLTLDDRQLPLQGSLGIAIFPTDGQSLPQLLHCADIAMYRAKRDGGGARLFQQSYSPAEPDTARAS